MLLSLEHYLKKFMSNKKRYSKTKNMTFFQVNSILNEYGGTGKDGHDYHDQIDDIKKQYWSLIEKKLNNYIKERENAPSELRRVRNVEAMPF